jgi:hypothetical protein
VLQVPLLHAPPGQSESKWQVPPSTLLHFPPLQEPPLHSESKWHVPPGIVLHFPLLQAPPGHSESKWQVPPGALLHFPPLQAPPLQSESKWQVPAGWELRGLAFAEIERAKKKRGRVTRKNLMASPNMAVPTPGGEYTGFPGSGKVSFPEHRGLYKLWSPVTEGTRKTGIPASGPWQGLGPGLALLSA